MGEQEQREITAMTLLEHAEAKRRLAALQAKAMYLGNDLRAIADAIAPFRGETRAMNAHQNALDALERYPEKEEIGKLLFQIREVEAEVTRLSDLLKGLGFQQ